MRPRRSLVAAGAGCLLALGLPLVALASGIPITPSSGLPVAPPVVPISTTPPVSVGVIDAAHPVRGFGAVLGSAPIVNNPVPLICAVGCYEYQFSIPAQIGQAPSILVGVKSTVTGPQGTFNPDAGFDLYVYGPDRRLVAGANGIGANGQSTQVDSPVPGQYTVVVTYNYAYDAGAGFRGEIRRMAGRAWTPAAPTCGITVSGVRGCFDLPRLRVLPAYALTTAGIPPVASTPLGSPLPVNVPLPTSCYADEIIGIDNLQVTGLSNPTLRCLRFTTNVQNVGAGPLTAQIPAAAVGPDGNVHIGYLPAGCAANQLIDRPGRVPVARPSGRCEFHIEHGHFHYDALLSYALYRAGAGRAPGPRVGVSRKASFCLADDDYFGYGSAGPNGPRVNVGQPDCNLPREVNPPVPGQPGSGTFITEGVMPGWGDVYTWDTPNQFIDITNVPSGVYDLVEGTNPAGSLLVAGPARTCALTRLRLTVGAVSDAVETLGTVASIPCPA